jgi:hypothetical protein
VQLFREKCGFQGIFHTKKCPDFAGQEIYMNQKDIVATALEQVEKEKQEAEISKIKGIVKAYLEKILDKKEAIKVLQKDLKELEADLDDLKLGRLDKIEGRQGKDPDHDKTTLIIVREIEKEYIPFQPWRSPFIIEVKPTLPYYPVYPITQTLGMTTGTQMFDAMTAMTQGTLTTSSDNPYFQTTGVNCQNFCGGVYDIGGHIINF